MVKKKVTVVLFSDNEVGGYCVIIPTVPNLATQGGTVEHAFEMAKECLELSLYDPDDSGYYNLDRTLADRAVVQNVEVNVASTAGDRLVPKKVTVALLRDVGTCSYTAVTVMFSSYWTEKDTAAEAFSAVKEKLETELSGGSEGGPSDFEYSYSEQVVVGTVELEMPIVPGPDWVFFDQPKADLELEA